MVLAQRLEVLVRVGSAEVARDDVVTPKAPDGSRQVSTAERFKDQMFSPQLHPGSRMVVRIVGQPTMPQRIVARVALGAAGIA